MGKNSATYGATNGVSVSLATDTTLAPGCRGFQVGTAGNVKVDYVDGGAGVTLFACVAGLPHAHQISRIYSTANGTTAADITALY